MENNLINGGGYILLSDETEFVKLFEKIHGKMNIEKLINKFINQKVKERKTISNDSELLKILQQIQTKDLLNFWMYFSANKAFSEANRIPDWKTKEQKQYFTNVTSTLIYKPKGKDTNGKYVIDRNDLINHIITYIEKIINQEINSNATFNKKPVIEKLPFYILRSTIIMIPLIIIGLIFSSSKFGSIILVCCGGLYGINFILFTVTTSINRRRFLKNNKQ